DQGLAQTFAPGADIGQYFGFFSGDVVDGGSGNDTIAGDQATAITHGLSPDPYFFGGYAGIFGDNDTATGGSGADSLTGDQGLAETFGRGLRNRRRRRSHQRGRRSG